MQENHSREHHPTMMRFIVYLLALTIGGTLVLPLLTMMGIVCAPARFAVYVFYMIVMFTIGFELFFKDREALSKY